MTIAEDIAEKFGDDGSVWDRDGVEIIDAVKKLAVSKKSGDGETVYFFEDKSSFVDYGLYWDLKGM